MNVQKQAGQLLAGEHRWIHFQGERNEAIFLEKLHDSYMIYLKIILHISCRGAERLSQLWPLQISISLLVSPPSSGSWLTCGYSMRLWSIWCHRIVLLLMYKSPGMLIMVLPLLSTTPKRRIRIRIYNRWSITRHLQLVYLVIDTGGLFCTLSALIIFFAKGSNTPRISSNSLSQSGDACCRLC